MNAAAHQTPKQSSASTEAADLSLLRDCRILVGIASFGTGHLNLLQHLISNYKRFPARVSIVVLSDGPKDLGPDVEVVVGLPSKNPWSLPFAHKKVFADRVENFDLFIYSEDDIGFRADQLVEFIRATESLGADEIAGYLRYEIKPNGERLLTEPWQHFHWKPDSARQRGPYTVAEFTNEHAGFYILTQSQLRRAIASGGFVREPYVGRYRLPETAATDPYTSCGFRKVIPVSHLEQFLVHHIPNKYVNDLPINYENFARQIETLVKIKDGLHPTARLCDVEPKNWHNGFQKSYYERPLPEILSAIPASARTVLSVGAGWGALEFALKAQGKTVTALPLDSVVGASIAAQNIEVVYGTLEDSLNDLLARRFDCVVMTNLLHLSPAPQNLIRKLATLVSPNGAVVTMGPNFGRFPRLLKRWLGIRGYSKLRNYSTSGISIVSPNTIDRILKPQGFGNSTIIWMSERGHELHPTLGTQLRRRFVATHWISRVTRRQS
ncbi:MAG TPA: methyltransferase domain-containing protein [Opitutaceae bacterium]|nr:methyltransferase domain-containing protein [Opitutaceae bacterium]